ncbi:MAG: 5-(carboxyamino)imidazole ribonucleotide synthase [Thermoleophilia bacterium]|nr:5-(carboxyamino)imidazole ribonucleotide synthase [Thermoleophilia bacterium]
MTALAAWPLGIRVAVLGQPTDPAVGAAAGLIEGDWRDAGALLRIGHEVGVLTLENEFVDASHLAAVADAGTPVRPDPARMAIVQDKALQKLALRDAGLPVPAFVVPDGPGDLEAAGRTLGWPLMLKSRTLGYDGYGNALCADITGALAAYPALAERGGGVLVEAVVTFERELAVMVARRHGGGDAVYPVVETRQHDHVLRELLCPAPIDPGVANEAKRVARAAAEACGGAGVTGVEMFHTADGGVLINELAPRPHNSGHHTIEACVTSQFENHLRGVLGLPLGSTALIAPGAALVNLLGGHDGPSNPDIVDAAGIEGAHIHLYGKADVRVRRKMGHVTALGTDPDDALQTARLAASLVRL